MVRQIRVYCFLALLMMAARPQAQEFNAVSLDHPAYKIIEMGIMQGIIHPPPAAKPWSIFTIQEKLNEMTDDPEQVLTGRELNTVMYIANSLDRKAGLQLNEGKYRMESYNYTFEAGLGAESSFFVGTSGGSVSSINMARIYANGDIADFMSWNLTALGEFLYIKRNEQGRIPSMFSYAFSKQWDGGVLSLKNPRIYAGWPDDPALAYGLEAEFNGIFYEQRLQLRLGRVRRDWGQGANGTTLFMNAHARPFAAFEATYSPLSFLNVSFLAGGLERFREDAQAPHDGLFSAALTAAQIELTPSKYIFLGIGGAAVLNRQSDAAFFVNLELRLPGMFTLWGSLFIDRLNSSFKNFFSASGNSYAYQAGIKTILRWLPLTVFSLSYTKIEPYCYAAFVNGGESLGYYLPPNSDELQLRFESMPFNHIKAHVQFQMIRHGVEYEAVPGSSPYNHSKYFLRDGVYQWDNVIKLGGSFNLKAVAVPLSIYAETGFVLTNFTTNGDADVGEKANYQPLNNETYRSVNRFIFSIGFRLFP